MSEYPEGVYLLKIRVRPETELKIDKLANQTMEGDYLYVGSAHGQVGFKRVSRHLKVSAGNHDGGHWHIDHLLQAAELVRAWLLPTEQSLECQLARELASRFPQPVRGFGSSDCNCKSHLFEYDDSKTSLVLKAMNTLETSARPFSFDP